MTRPTNQQIKDFMVDLLRVQKKHDLWIEAEENSPLWVSNDEMDGTIEVFWEPVGDGQPVECLIAKLEPERLSTETPEREKSPHSSVSLKGTTSDDQ